MNTKRSNHGFTAICKGFTLIELLVVIAIIALLVSILLPSLKKAKDLANRVACASNSRSIAMALSFYLEEYDGVIPPGHATYPIGDVFWFFLLRPYMDGPDTQGRRSTSTWDTLNPTIICPADPNHGGDANAAVIQWGHDEFRRSYNPNGEVSRGSIKVEDIVTPSDTLYMADHDWINLSSGTNWIWPEVDVNGNVYPTGTLYLDMLPGWHDGIVNVSMLDSHVEQIKIEDLYADAPRDKVWYPSR